MALKKEIIQDSGIKTEYHKVSKVDIDYTNKKMFIIVDSYFNNIYRNEEKEQIAKVKLNEDYQKALDIEITKDVKNEVLIKELAENINSFYLSENKPIDKKISTTKVEMDLLENTSLESIYNELKKLDIYINCEDI